MEPLAFFQSLMEPWLLFLAEDPMLRMLQVCMIVLGLLLIFFVFFTTKDILLRTNSFTYMFVCIVLVAALPVVGFLLYLLIRPSRTLRDKSVEDMLKKLLEQKKKDHSEKPSGTTKKAKSEKGVSKKTAK